MFGIFCAANGVFVFFFIKETKNMTLEDMDIMFGTVEAEQRAADVEHMMHKGMEHDDRIEHASQPEKTATAAPAQEVGDEKHV